MTRVLDNAWLGHASEAKEYGDHCVQSVYQVHMCCAALSLCLFDMYIYKCIYHLTVKQANGLHEKVLKIVLL